MRVRFVVCVRLGSLWDDVRGMEGSGRRRVLLASRFKF
jgi:hypothetical protein